MSLSGETHYQIAGLLKKAVIKKLDSYAMYSFIHSMNTTLGMSIWEQIAKILAKGAGMEVKRQYKLLGEIDKPTEALIDDNAQVETNLAIPYNPYHPKPYERWTLVGLFDLDRELYAGEDFWNFVANDDIYNELLNVFEEVGNELRPKIDNRFAQFRVNYN